MLTEITCKTMIDKETGYVYLVFRDEEAAQECYDALESKNDGISWSCCGGFMNALCISPIEIEGHCQG